MIDSRNCKSVYTLVSENAHMKRDPCYDYFGFVVEIFGKVVKTLEVLRLDFISLFFLASVQLQESCHRK